MVRVHEQGKEQRRNESDEIAPYCYADYGNGDVTQWLTHLQYMQRVIQPGEAAYRGSRMDPAPANGTS